MEREPSTVLVVVYLINVGFLPGASGKESACQCRRCMFDPWVEKTPWRRKWHPTPVFLPGKSHGQRSVVGYSPWGCKRVEHDLATELTHMDVYKF